MSTAFTVGGRNRQAPLEKLRDVARQELVAGQLAGELPPAPVRIIDLGAVRGRRPSGWRWPRPCTPWQVPGGDARYLSSARQAGVVADRAGVGRLLLTHLWPGTDPDQAVRAAAEGYPGPIAVASPGLTAELLGE